MESFITSEIIREILEAPPRSLNSIKAELLFLDGAYILHSRDGNASRYKCLSSTALRNAFSGMPIDSGWLNPGIIRHGSSQAGDWAVKFVPPQIYNINCTDLGMLTVPLPAMVFVGKATKYWIWATKTKKFAPDASLFRVPLPNVYLEWGQICWGTNTPPECNAQTINSAWEMFVTSPFNSHLSSNKSRRHDRDIREQLLALYSKKAKKYPVSDLQPLSRDLTVNKLLEAMPN